MGEQEDYCVGCFAKLDRHSGSYHVRGLLTLTITEPGWTMRSELLFLHALIRLGNFYRRFTISNFKVVSEFMAYHHAQFTEEELEKHY